MRNLKRIAIIGGLALAGVATAGVLRAFPNATNWTDDPSQSVHCGNGGIYATGGVKDWGITCTMCHINDVNQQGNISATVSANPPFTGNKYLPGQLYTITVNLVNEQLGKADQSNNRNGMSATFEDVNGNPMGSLAGDAIACAAAPPSLPDPLYAGTTYVYGPGCHNVTSLGKQGPGLTQWIFKWQAPAAGVAAGTGAITMYYGVVDGNTDKKSLGDDVKMGKVQLAEGP